jgi:hypothetical protein
MAGPKREYRRLPGRGRRRGSFFAFSATQASLWAGSDHVLSVYSTGYTEEYKRFYYRDIQAIVNRKVNHGALVNFFSALFLIFFSLLAITRTTTAVAVVWWIFSGISLLILAGNLLLGPTCICHIQTAVTREELPSLGRERTARKVVNILRPLIEAAQGALNPDEIASRSAEFTGGRGPVAPPSARVQPVGAVANYRGTAHEALFYLLLLDGLMSGIHIFVQNLPLTILDTLCTIGFSIAVIVALTKQQGRGLNAGLRVVTWTAFVYVLVVWASSYVIGIYEVVRHPEAARNGQWEILKMMSTISPADDRVMLYLLVFSVVCAIPIGFAGIVLLKKFRISSGVAESASPPTEQ